MVLHCLDIGDTGGVGGCPSCDRLSFEALTLQVAVEKLESDLERQRANAEREEARLRGQLAESCSDARSLRLQLARGFSTTAAGTSVSTPSCSSPCTNCQRLQQLLDLLQSKKQTHHQHQPDVVKACAISTTADRVDAAVQEEEEARDGDVETNRDAAIQTEVNSKEEIGNLLVFSLFFRIFQGSN